MVLKSIRCGSEARMLCSFRPFRAFRWGGGTQGSAFGSTQGYIPVAASRLSRFAVSPLPTPYPMQVSC